MQKKQVTVNVTVSLTLMLENEEFPKGKIQEMVDSTIANMDYNFSMDTNTGLYDDGYVGSIIETEIIADETMAIADVSDECVETPGENHDR